MLLFDLETTGLLGQMDRIHCIHMIDTDTGEAFRYNDGFYSDGTEAPRHGSIADALERLRNAPEIGGHNILGFDLPACQVVEPDFDVVGDCFDTLIAARLLWPNLMEIDSKAVAKGKRPPQFTSKLIGSHKLEAWGYRLGAMKSEYSGGWDRFTKEMDDYCAQDVVATKALYDRIIEKGYSPDALKLEFQVADAVSMQERWGFSFNREAAEKLEGIIRSRLAFLGDRLRETFPPWVEPVRKGGKPFVFIPKRDNKKLGYVAGVPVPKFQTISFNPASRDHIANRLSTLFGWQPVEFTDTGKPKVDETTLEGLDYPEAKLIVEYLTLEKRLGQLAEGKQAWIRKVREDGRIHGRVNTVGAVTRRMTHSDPNMAQVPACGAVYGTECRSLFTASTALGTVLVGCDAEGLELRMLAHYMALYDDGAYAQSVIYGNQKDGTDVHTVNQKLVGLNKRSSAKTWIYAYLYGAGNFKLGSIIYDDFTDEHRTKFNARHPAGESRDRAFVRLGKKSRDAVEQGLPALGRLQEKVKDIARKGYIKTLDGGRLKVRSQHAALNTLLQGGGAVVMKKALAILVEDLRRNNWHPDRLAGCFRKGDDVIGFTANVHDEFQIEVSADYAEWLAELAKDSIRKAGEALGLRCPLAGASAIGMNWAETH